MTTYNITTVVSTGPLPAGKYKGLIPPNREKDYQDVTVAAIYEDVRAGEKPLKAEVSWPWLSTIPANHPAVMEANQKALDMARKTLLDYLHAKKIKPLTPVERIAKWVAREIEYLKSMAKF